MSVALKEPTFSIPTSIFYKQHCCHQWCTSPITKGFCSFFTRIRRLRNSTINEFDAINIFSVDLKRDNNDKIICATWCAGEMCSWNHRHWAQQAAGEALTWDLHSCHMGARTLWCHWCRVMWNGTISKHRNNDIKTLSVCICTSYASISHEFLNLVRSWRAKKNPHKNV